MRIPHHRVVALDDAAAAEREDGVADEDELLVGQVQRDVVERMARRLDDVAPSAPAQSKLSPSLTVRSYMPVSAALASGPIDLAIVGRLQRRDAFDMVEVLVGDEDVR